MGLPRNIGLPTQSGRNPGHPKIRGDNSIGLVVKFVGVQDFVRKAGPAGVAGVYNSERRFSATLRIFGDIKDLHEITNQVMLDPTHVHKKNERRSQHSEPYHQNMWSYTAPVADESPLSDHLDALYEVFRPHIAYLKDTQEKPYRRYIL